MHLVFGNRNGVRVYLHLGQESEIQSQVEEEHNYMSIF